MMTRIPEAGLTDPVHQVIHDVDRAGSSESGARRRWVGGVENDRRNVVETA